MPGAGHAPFWDDAPSFDRRLGELCETVARGTPSRPRVQPRGARFTCGTGGVSRSRRFVRLSEHDPTPPFLRLREVTMVRRHTRAALVLGAAFALPACSDAVAPSWPRPPAVPRLSDGLEIGQCVLQYGIPATQVGPDPDGSTAITAPAGDVVVRVAIEAGTASWLTPDGANGTYVCADGRARSWSVKGRVETPAHGACPLSRGIFALFK